MTTEIKVPPNLVKLDSAEHVIKKIKEAQGVKFGRHGNVISQSNMSPEEKTNISNKFTDAWCRGLLKYNCEDNVEWCSKYKSKQLLRKGIKDGSWIRAGDFCNDWLDKNSNLEKTIYSDICTKQRKENLPECDCVNRTQNEMYKKLKPAMAGISDFCWYKPCKGDNVNWIPSEDKGPIDCSGTCAQIQTNISEGNIDVDISDIKSYSGCDLLHKPEPENKPEKKTDKPEPEKKTDKPEPEKKHEKKPEKKHENKPEKKEHDDPKKKTSSTNTSKPFPWKITVLIVSIIIFLILSSVFVLKLLIKKKS